MDGFPPRLHRPTRGTTSAPFSTAIYKTLFLWAFGHGWLTYCRPKGSQKAFGKISTCSNTCSVEPVRWDSCRTFSVSRSESL